MVDSWCFKTKLKGERRRSDGGETRDRRRSDGETDEDQTRNRRGERAEGKEKAEK